MPRLTNCQKWPRLDYDTMPVERGSVTSKAIPIRAHTRSHREPLRGQGARTYAERCKRRPPIQKVISKALLTAESWADPVSLTTTRSM